MNYTDVKNYETLRTLREWLPFSKGSPKETRTADNQYDRANFVFFTDSHIDHINTEPSLENVSDTIDFINSSPVPFDAVIHTGDIITPFYIVDKKEALATAKQFFDIAEQSSSPFLFPKGNHDLNDWENLPENVFTDKDWGNLFLDNAEKKHGIVREAKKSGDKSTWHYFDVEKHKIRIVMLDIQDTDKVTTTEDGTVKYHGGKSFYFSNEQMTWIANCALNFDDKEEKDWGVIFASHLLIDTDTGYEAISPKFFDLCKAFQEQGRYTHKYVYPENEFFNLDIDADFSRYANSDKKPHMICCLFGHVHDDNYKVINGINTIWTTNASATNVSGDARTVRIPGTSTQNAFDIINIDTQKRKIRLFRFGAGVNCHGVGGSRFLPDGISY